MAPVIVGSALAGHDHAFVPAAAGLCLAFALMVQIGTNLANDYFDFVHGADTAARVGPRRAVASGLVRPAAMRRAMAAVFSLAFIIGLGLIHWGGPWMLAVGVTSILCGFAYTGGPWPLGYHGLGDVFVFLFFGLVAVTMTYFVQAGRLTAHAVLRAGAAIGLLGFQTSSSLKTITTRRPTRTPPPGKRTLVVRFGRRFARAQFALSLCGSLSPPLVFLATGYGPWCLLPLLAAPLAWSHARRLATAATPSELVSLLGDTGKLTAIYAALFAAGVLF